MAYPSYLPYTGGIETHIHGLATYLASRNHQVFVFTPKITPDWNKTQHLFTFGQSEDKKQPDIEEKDGVKIIRYKPNVPQLGRRLSTWHFLLQFNIALREFVKLNEVDIVHLHDIQMNSSFLLFRFGLKTKIVETVHGSICPTTSPILIKKFALRFLLRRPEKIICISKKIRSEVESFGVQPEKVQYIPNWVDADTFSPANHHAHKSSFVILFVGRITRSQDKGVGLLIQVIKNLRGKGVSVGGLIVGTGADLRYFQSLCSRHGLSDSIHFTGFIPKEKLVECYRNADIFVLPSEYEGLSIAILEALSTGLPVVCTAVGSNREIVDENVGRLMQERNVQSLEEALQSLIANERILASMRHRARSRILSEFDSKIVLPKIESVYEEII